MKCLQKLYSSPSWLVVSLCLLCTLFLTMINTSNTSAVSVTGTFDSSTPNYTPICNNNDSNVPNCSDYSYLIIENNTPSPDISSTYFILFDFGLENAGARLPYLFTNYYSISNYSSVWFRNPTTFGSNTYIYTLTDSLSSNEPVGSISITSNGTYNVKNYAEAVVDVPPEVVQGDYHDDLVDLKQAIILVPAVCLVIYFFYAIYKMIMGGVRR